MKPSKWIAAALFGSAVRISRHRRSASANWPACMDLTADSNSVAIKIVPRCGRRRKTQAEALGGADGVASTGQYRRTAVTARQVRQEGANARTLTRHVSRADHNRACSWRARPGWTNAAGLVQGSNQSKSGFS